MKTRSFNQVRVTVYTLILFCSINLFILSGLEAVINRGIAPIPVIDSKGNQVVLYKESHALIVGISEYSSDWPMLLSLIHI